MKNREYKIFSRKAFTLIELLIVISLLGLLMGILLPSFGKARDAARRTRCRSNLHSVSVGFRMYLDKNDDVMPYAAEMPSLGLNELPRIADVLADDLNNPEVLRCPGDTRKNYYLSEGSSYTFNSMLSGQRVSNSFFTKAFGEQKTIVMHDYEPFHGPAGRLGSSSYLFADGHVGDVE